MKTFYGISEDKDIDQGMLGEIVLQVLLPGVSERMNAWCEGGKGLPVSGWLGKNRKSYQKA